MNYNLIPLFAAIPLASAFLISLFGKKLRWFGDVLSNLSTLALLAISGVLLNEVRQVGMLAYKVGGWVPPIGIALVADHLTCLMLIIVNLVAFLVNVYAISYMRRYTSKGQFYTLFMLMIAGMNGLIISGDMFNLFVFLEIASIASYALVAFGTEQEELEASFKYMVMGSIASCLILLGIALLYSATSTLNMADMARVLRESPSDKVRLFVSILFVVGFGLKAALVPFHWWLPDAHPSAPAPISALLSGLLIKTLGVYALARIFFNVLGASEFLSVFMVLGTISMLVGVGLAIGQWDFKRLLAYSSISQIGYIVLGLGLGTPLGIMGALFHLLNHATFKSLLFLNSGAVVYATGTRDLQELGGLREKMPVSGNTCLVASMSVAGIPPFNGFWSKLIIITACVRAGHPVYAFWAILASVITLAYILKIQKYGFFGELKAKWDQVKEVPFSMKFSMVVLALVCVASGALLVPQISDAFLKTAGNVLLNGKEYAELVFQVIQ